MRVRIHVQLKPGVFDPQGQTIHHAAETLGFEGIREIRQGKFFEIELDASLARDTAVEQMTRLAHELLANPVIEDYTVEVMD
jgi:phosphoribosylformylglycinamidine synthase